MILYARTPGLRTRQIVGDLLVAAWIGAWAWLGRVVHDLVAALARPALALADAGTTFSGTMRDTGSRVGDVPLVGDRLRSAFEQAAAPGGNVTDAGHTLASTIGTLATALGITSALGPILLAAIPWLLYRSRFVRRATAAARFVDADADLDLFALRALVHQPMHRLARISDDPAGAYRRGDATITRALAALELADAGLRPPARVPEGTTARRSDPPPAR